MSETNVGANLVFALRTTIVCEPMPEANVSNSLSNIGLIPVFVRGEHKVGSTRRITKYLLRSTRKFMIAYLCSISLGMLGK